jgi:hypothetical protein
VVTTNQLLLSEKTFALFDTSSAPGSLVQQCHTLVKRQMQNWPQLEEGYEALKSIRVRDVACDGFNVKVQWNPNRITSTAANTELEALRKRKCFLCLKNLPESQKGILYQDEYLILCNPAPIFPSHFTISCVSHLPQEYEAALDVMLNIAKDLNPEFTVFYNGPVCGASAPDHLHFQMSPRRSIPVEVDAVEVRRRKRFYYKHHVAGFTLANYGRPVIIIESSNKDQLAQFIRSMLNEWKSVIGLPDEPKMNVLCSYQEEIWRVILFPRSKHRPDIFFKEGEERMLISPAAVDIGGLIILPRENDFLRIDAPLIESIFKEVSVEPSLVQKILEGMV